MSFLERLFGRKKTPPRRTAEREHPALITAYDEYGRAVQISRDEWRGNVLRPNLEHAWNDPDDLYNSIVYALQDGFAPDLVKAAKHLMEIDPVRARGVTIYGITRLAPRRRTTRRGAAAASSELDSSWLRRRGRRRPHGERRRPAENAARGAEGEKPPPTATSPPVFPTLPPWSQDG